MEPRKIQCGRPRGCISGGHADTPNGLACSGRPGSLERGRGTIGVPQERGRSCHLRLNERPWESRSQSPGPGIGVGSRGKYEMQAQWAVPPSEGNEVRRDGWQEVLAPE